MRIVRIVALVTGVLVAGCATQASAGLLGSFQTVFNTDWTSAGVGGLRGVGAGSISLSGVSGSVSSAYLYWHGPTNSADASANANINFAGNAITGTNIGISSDNCWGFLNSQAYRADVSSLISGNGSYSLSGLTSPGVEINGASLVVFFDDGVAGNNRDVVMFDGNDSNITNPNDPDGWQATLNGINYTSGSASLVMGVSDGQAFPDESVSLNGTQVVGAGSNWDGNTVPVTPGSSVTNGGLWDITTYDVTSLLSPGINNFLLTTGPLQSDCLSLIHLAFDLPAGSAPPNPTIPEPASLAVWSLLGFACCSGARYRRKQV